MKHEAGTTRRPKVIRSLWGGMLLGVVAAALLVPASGSARSETAPKNTGQPVISGSAVQGSTLTTSNGSWSGTAPIAYQYRWLRCDTSGGGVNGVNCATIPGETRKSYVLDRGGRRPPDPLPGDRHEPGWNGELQLQRDESRQGQRRRAEERATADDLWHSGGEQHPDRQQGHLDRRPDDRVRGISGAVATHTAAAVPRSAARPRARTCSSPSTSAPPYASASRPQTVRAPLPRHRHRPPWSRRRKRRQAPRSRSTTSRCRTDSSSTNIHSNRTAYASTDD